VQQEQADIVHGLLVLPEGAIQRDAGKLSWL
jgi:hypothetical protein